MNSGLPIGDIGNLFSVSLILSIYLLTSGGDYFINNFISF